MKVLVTGGLGFIGSNFIQHILKNTDLEVTNIDAEFFGSSHHNLENIHNPQNYTFVKGNITNRKCKFVSWSSFEVPICSI